MSHVTQASGEPPPPVGQLTPDEGKSLPKCACRMEGAEGIEVVEGVERTEGCVGGVAWVGFGSDESRSELSDSTGGLCGIVEVRHRHSTDVGVGPPPAEADEATDAHRGDDDSDGHADTDTDRIDVIFVNGRTQRRQRKRRGAWG